MTFTEYLEIEAEHWTGLKEMRRSAKHYLYRREHPLEDSAILTKGRAGHTAVLESDRFLRDYVLFEGATRRGKVWEAFKAAHSTKTILKVDEYDTALAVRDAVRAHPKASAIFRSGEVEKVIVWTDEETGLRCKARLDHLGESLTDLKITGRLTAHDFANTTARFGYHCQLALYRRGVCSLGRPPPTVKMVAVEAKAPHDVAVFRISEDDLKRADDEITNLLRQVAECRNLAKWPGQFPEETLLEVPNWGYGIAFDGKDNDFDLSELGLVSSATIGEEV